MRLAVFETQRCNLETLHLHYPGHYPDGAGDILCDTEGTNNTERMPEHTKNISSLRQDHFPVWALRALCEREEERALAKNGLSKSWASHDHF